ncbi:GGDEF domain-containing protein [Arthrobacter sp. CAU 1506]|uniref:GGDEF domain-containing protein n=1 Tax=Arthrobacter sp. CAU 1506 TaxID=2560052 RepID=UPI0010ABA6E5|nr:GGDEF domain-containing protein [Arthrobacter sp. CAU 1506]TJY67277.1 GGDEF domain-containing protein [Arthrobacter sp. CAU 1506]
MVLDTATLRVAFAVVGIVLLVLFYMVTYRRTRAPYSAWWCTAIAMFLTGSACYLLNGTGHQWWATTLANVLVVFGAAAVWTGTRSLNARKPAPLLIVAGMALAGGSTAVENPGTNVWAGGMVFLAFVTLFFGLAASELFRLRRGFTRLRGPLAVVSVFLSAFYFCRFVTFLTDGPGGRIFETFFGGEATTVVNMAVMVVVSFSMVTFSEEQAARDLRKRALHDGLTGLLNRNAFLDLAADRIDSLRRGGRSGSLMLADLDHFKTVNDTHGHPGGDKALRAFAQVCTDTVRSTDLVGRYGGEEFVLLLSGAAPEQAKQVAHLISQNLRTADFPDFTLPTVSFGIAAIGEGPDTPDANTLDAAIEAADAALYQAKSEGRDRAVLAEDRNGDNGSLSAAGGVRS